MLWPVGGGPRPPLAAFLQLWKRINAVLLFFHGCEKKQTLKGGLSMGLEMWFYCTCNSILPLGCFWPVYRYAGANFCTISDEESQSGVETLNKNVIPLLSKST